MLPDPIVDEVRRIRLEHAAKHGNDLDRIVEALRAEERESSRPLLSPGPRRLTADKVSEDRKRYPSQEEGNQ